MSAFDNRHYFAVLLTYSSNKLHSFLKKWMKWLRFLVHTETLVDYRSSRDKCVTDHTSTTLWRKTGFANLWKRVVLNQSVTTQWSCKEQIGCLTLTYVIQRRSHETAQSLHFVNTYTYIICKCLIHKIYTCDTPKNESKVIVLRFQQLTRF